MFDLLRCARRGLFCRPAMPALMMGLAFGGFIPVKVAQAENILFDGPGDYSLTRGDQVAGGPRTVDVTLTSGNMDLDLANVVVANPDGSYAYPGAAIAATNLGAGDIKIVSGSITASGTGQTYAINATSGAGAINITSGTIQATAGTFYNSGRAISAISSSGPVAITSDTISTDSPTGIYAQGSSVAITSNSISVAGDSDYSFDPTGAIFAQDTGGGITLQSTNITANGTDLSGILVNGIGAISIDSGTITASGLYARGIASYGTGDIAIKSGTIAVSGYGAVGISVSGYAGNDISITSDTITTTGSAIGMEVSAGAGSLNISSNKITTADDFGYGMEINGGSGDIAIKSGTIATAGQYAAGILGNSYSDGTGAITIDSSSVTTTGAEADAISIATAGPITINSGEVTTSNIASSGILAVTQAGSIAIHSGTVSTNGYGSSGIRANTGNGDISIVAGTTATASGTDTFSTSPAITAFASGAVQIVADDTSATGEGAMGIEALGDTVTVAAKTISTPNAGATAVYAQGRTVTVSAQNVTSGSNGIIAYGSEAVTVVAGDVAAGDQPAITAIGGGSADVSVAGSVTSVSGPAVIVDANDVASFTLASTGRLDGAGQVMLTGGNGETVTNAGTITGDAITPILSAGGGALAFNNSGSFTGLIGFTGSDDVVNNSGTYRAFYDQSFGAGVDTVNNSGIFAVRPDAKTAGTVRLTGLETFNNSGMVDLRNGHPGDVLSLSGSFAGSGDSVLGIDVTSGSAAATDRLVVAGAITGTTRVMVNGIGTAVLNPGLVFATGGTGSSATAFTMPSGSAANRGFIRYSIAVDTANGSYSLVGTPGDAVYRTLKINEGAQQLWYKSADAWSAHMSDLRDAHFAGSGVNGGRVWGQMYGQSDTRDASQTVSAFGQSRSVGLSYRQDAFGGQLGVDLGKDGGDGAFAFGLTGGYLNANLNFDGSADRVAYDSANIGAYASYVSGGLFANALGKYDYLWVHSSSPLAGYESRFHGMSYGAQGEIGFRIGSDSLYAEPVITGAYTRTDLKNLTALGASIDFDKLDGVRGKAGLRVGSRIGMAGGAVATVYAQGNYVHEFDGKDGMVFTSGGTALSYRNRPIRDYGEGKIGFSIATAGNVTGFLEAFGADGSSYKGGGARTGLRVKI
jgi:outer membrane autotransporter protein